VEEGGAPRAPVRLFWIVSYSFLREKRSDEAAAHLVVGGSCCDDGRSPGAGHAHQFDGVPRTGSGTGTGGRA
jgi:hypothetical protein